MAVCQTERDGALLVIMQHISWLRGPSKSLFPCVVMKLISSKQTFSRTGRRNQIMGWAVPTLLITRTSTLSLSGEARWLRALHFSSNRYSNKLGRYICFVKPCLFSSKTVTIELTRLELKFQSWIASERARLVEGRKMAWHKGSWWGLKIESVTEMASSLVRQGKQAFSSRSESSIHHHHMSPMAWSGGNNKTPAETVHFYEQMFMEKRTRIKNHISLLEMIYGEKITTVTQRQSPWK